MINIAKNTNLSWQIMIKQPKGCIFMAVTEYGRAVRLARSITKDTLLTMSERFKKSVAFLSAIETGRTKIPMDFVEEVESYFNQKGYHFDNNLKVLASIDNKSVGIDGLSYQQQMLVAGFANSQYTQEELQKIFELINVVNQVKEASADDRER